MSLELTDKPFIIAEVGTCHADINPINKFGRAIKYVIAAAKAGASAVKFQVFDEPHPESMFCWMPGDNALNIRWLESRISLDGWKIIKQACDELGIKFLASVFEYETVKWLSELNVEATKVASRAAGNLVEFKDAPKPLLVSNGMYEVIKNVNYVWGRDFNVLECEANYPSVARWRDIHAGFSDHSGNPWRAIDAMARGCKLVEVHFYIDSLHAGPNLPVSLTLDELKLVCEARDGIATL